MSRHTFSGQKPQYRIVVGWDHALQTYFVQVEDLSWKTGQITEDVTIGDCPEEGLLLWEGGDRVIDDLAEIEQLLAPYGNLPSDIKECLVHDRTN